MNNEIGKNIKKYRIQKKFSREELAENLGISIHTLAKYEQGQRTPNIDTLKKIADALDIAMVEFIGMKKAIGAESTTKEEKEILKSVNSHLSSTEFLFSNSELIANQKQDIFFSIRKIAELSNITIEEIRTKMIQISETDEENPQPIYDGPDFNGIEIKYKDKIFSLTEEEYYKLAGRIIDSIAINILAAKDY